MSKIHVIKDESLGGILREYVEVDRKAEIGDYVLFKRSGGHYKLKSDDVSVANRDIDRGVIVVLEPTDIVHIPSEQGNVQRYRLEPVESTEERDVDETVLDLLANLVRRVAELERKLSELEEQVDSNTKDIRMIAIISTEIDSEVTPRLQRKVVYEYDGYYAD